MDVKIVDDKVVVTHPNFKTTYTITRGPEGYGMWSIQVDLGKVPEKLKGGFTSSKGALQSLSKHLFHSKPSATVRRDVNAEERKERNKVNASKLQSEDGK